MAVVRAPLVPGLLTTAPVSPKCARSSALWASAGRRANELLKKKSCTRRGACPGQGAREQVSQWARLRLKQIQVPTDMDLSLMEDLSDAEAMDEEEPPPKYRPLIGVRLGVLVRPSRRWRGGGASSTP